MSKDGNDVERERQMTLAFNKAVAVEAAAPVLCNRINFTLSDDLDQIVISLGGTSMLQVGENEYEPRAKVAFAGVMNKSVIPSIIEILTRMQNNAPAIDNN